MLDFVTPFAERLVGHLSALADVEQVALRRPARERGLKINEYGVYRGKTRIGGDTEESVYQAVGLSWIPPEQREGEGGEIEAARARGGPAEGGPR